MADRPTHEESAAPVKAGAAGVTDEMVDAALPILMAYEPGVSDGGAVACIRELYFAMEGQRLKSLSPSSAP